MGFALVWNYEIKLACAETCLVRGIMYGGSVNIVEPEKGDQDILFRPFNKPEATSAATRRRVNVIQRLPRPVLGCFVLILGLFLVIGTITFAADRICYGNLTQLMPIYPNAEFRVRAHNLVTEFGMGVTSIVLVSPDDPTTVRNWYGRETSAYRIQTRENRTPFATLAKAQVDVTHNPDGDGSQIIMYGTCVN